MRVFSEVSFLHDVAAAFEDARRGRARAYKALVEVAHEKLGGMQCDTFARVCLALAFEFDSAYGSDTHNDGKCMARLINTYLFTIESIRSSGDYEVNMPFFAVAPEGRLPVHLQRTLTADAIAELAQRPAVTTSEEPSGTPAQEPHGDPVGSAPTRRWFWPFGG